MRKTYSLFALLILCINLQAQMKNTQVDRPLSWKISRYWLDTLKKYNGGENWKIKGGKDAEEFLKRTESPYWEKHDQVFQMDIPNSTDPNVGQRRPTTLKRVDLSNNNLTGKLADNPIYEWENSGFKKGIWTIHTSFYFSYNQLNSVTARFLFGASASQYRQGEVLAFDHNKISEFNMGFESSTIGGNVHGSPKVYLNNNKLSEYNPAWERRKGEAIWWLKYDAEFLRVENNLFNFKELKRFSQAVYKGINAWTSGSPGSPPAPYKHPDWKFTYAPQLPQGTESSETLNAGDHINLSYALPDSENKYIWELNGKEIPLSEGKEFNAEMSTARAGMYRCKVTNAALPELTIYSKAQMRFLQKDGNNAPTNFNINNNKAVRNSPQWTVVGEFGGEDPDNDQIYFRLVDHEGDNADFRIIDGNTLVSSTVLFEWSYKTEYKIRVQAYDIYGGTFEKEISIERGEVTGPVPTGMKLSKTALKENIIAKIGDFELSGVTTSEFSFSLPDAKDNKFFKINGTSLETKIALNYEKKRFYTMRVIASKDDVSITKDFVIEALNVNDAPNSLTITNNEIEIGKDPGSLIGILVATDEDPDDYEFTYIIDSDEFLIRYKNQLQAKKEFTKADIGERTIKVTAIDDEGAESEFSLALNVIEKYDPSKARIVLDNTLASENFTGRVAMLSVNQGGDYVYELVAGANAEHNSWFEISGKELRLIKEVDYEKIKLLHIRVQAGDIETELDLSVQNVNEKPRAFGYSNNLVGTEVNSLVGKLIMDDPEGDHGTYQLLEQGDHAYFQIKQDELILVKENDKPVYNIRVRASDGEFELEQDIKLHSGAGISAQELSDIGIDNFLIKTDWASGTNVCHIIVEGGQDVDLSLSGADANLFQIEDGVLKTNTDDLGKSVYSVDITATSGGDELSKTFDFYVPIVIDGTDYIDANDVKLYPNPVQNVMYVQTEQKGGSIAVYDLTGIKLKQFEITDNVQELPMSDLSLGVYILQYTYSDKVVKRQFVKN